MNFFKKSVNPDQQENINEGHKINDACGDESTGQCMDSGATPEKQDLPLESNENLDSESSSDSLGCDLPSGTSDGSSMDNDEIDKEKNTDVSLDNGEDVEEHTSQIHDYYDGDRIEECFCEQKELLEKILSEFSMKLKYDETKQQQIDQLYSENLAYREGLVEKFLTKLIQVVIEQIDDAEKQISYFKNVEFSESNFQKLLNSTQDIALSFRDMLLERFDIESWQSDPDTPFDPSSQRTLRTTATTDPSKIKTLHSSIRYGYKKSDGQIIRPELVNVYILDKNTITQEEQMQEENSLGSSENNE